MIRSHPETRPSRVTVVVTTYNRGAMLRRAIDSVLAQDCEGFTLLVSDNASTDETPAIVAQYDDPRLVSIRLPENVGWLRNINQAARRVETEYVAFLGDDDVVYPGALGRAVAALDRHPTAGFVHGRAEKRGGDGSVVAPAFDWTGFETETLELGAAFIRRSIAQDCRVIEPTAVIRAVALPPGPLDARDGSASDVGMWLRIALRWDVCFLPHVQAGVGFHEGSETASRGRTTAAGHQHGLAQRKTLIAVKRRFLVENADRITGGRHLRRAAGRFGRRQLLDVVAGYTFPARRLSSTVRLLSGAARIDPVVVASPGAWRLLAGAVVGPRVVSRLRGERAVASITSAPEVPDRG